MDEVLVKPQDKSIFVRVQLNILNFVKRDNNTKIKHVKLHQIISIEQAHKHIHNINGLLQPEEENV